MNIILKLAISYLEAHPEVVEKLVAQLFEAIINAVTAHNASQKA